MSLRETDQLSFADALSFKRAGLNERLGRIAALIDWAALDSCLSHCGLSGAALRVMRRCFC